MEPLHHHAAGLQPLARERVELLREEAADAGDPHVGRIGDDDVEGLLAREQRVAAVGDEEPHARVGEDVAVLRRELLGGLPGRALDVGDLDRPCRVARRGRRRHAGAEPDDEDVARIGVQQHREVAEQELVGHVARIGGGVGLAVGAVEGADPWRSTDSVVAIPSL